jgi:hypothetical protein
LFVGQASAQTQHTLYHMPHLCYSHLRVVEYALLYKWNIEWLYAMLKIAIPRRSPVLFQNAVLVKWFY